MIRSVQEIREEYESNLASESHVCVVKEMSSEAYRVHVKHGTVPRDACRIYLVEDGVKKMSISKSCTPIIDDEWMDDVKVLLDRIDRLERNLISEYDGRST